MGDERWVMGDTLDGKHDGKRLARLRGMHLVAVCDMSLGQGILSWYLGLRCA